ncbi:n-acetylgalactosamine-4-sulfatase [Pseudalgibacter alginicilyticus]|uniref:N-acetylgalactosamine-4-sulfatase n=2 Tax=Pseudalgibacter alginicilyticus TaxID=1736674 RepID=A0A0P0DA54_9FLAO|nr:n-acetylgalactosamine-4-sulfatase [Pseudalgibacter alginicilyticus]
MIHIKKFNLMKPNLKKITFQTIFICFALLLVSCKSEVKKKEISTVNEKPNVILIMVDDVGYGDIAAHGNEWIKTPNIDKLYAESIRLTDYHVSPTCAPTRAAIMTGHHNYRTGVFFTIKGRSLILEKEKTMAEIFKANGYNTAMFGKWHLGDNYPFRPQDKGFDDVLMHGGGGVGQTMDYWNNDYFDDTYVHNGKLKKYKGYSTDIWFKKAMQYIEKQKDKPFFCYLSTNAAHSPYWVDDKYSTPYKDNENIPNAAFYGMITNIDENIGKLVEYLKSIDLMDNTILIFTADNGSAAGNKMGEGEDRLDGFIAKGNNAGMRGVKASMYEGGHRVPFYIHWKNGGVNVGQDINTLTAHYDILPTLIDLCGLELKEDLKFDGSSLVPLIQGDKTNFEDRIVYVNTQFSTDPVPWKRTALMHQNWRLVEGTELYNLDLDPEQRTNIADQFPEKVEAYRAAYDKWWAEISPTFEEKPYFIIGHQAENPATLFCHDWHSETFTPWKQDHIREGQINNGFWRVKVAETGMYNIKLRRWPEETRLALNAKAPLRSALPGTSVTESKKSKVLIIEKAKINIQNKEISKDVNPSDEFVEFEVELEQGETHLQTWFTLDSKEELGAYYATIQKL